MDVSLRKKNTKKNVSNSNNSGVVRNKYGTGVRSYLVNAGFNNADIGYDQPNNKVTYKGKPIISPNIVVDGTSYANEASLRNLALKLHDDEGSDLVSATDYANQKLGIKNAVSSSDGYVSVGDSMIRANVSSNGNAYVPRSEMEKALAEYELGIDYKSERDIYNDWQNNYGAKILYAINELTADEWSYNPQEDPAYLAYADMYKREGERAFKDAYGNAIANTAGMTNSGALTQGAQSMGYYMDKLSDKIPELMKDDYERYAKERQVRIDALDRLIKLGTSSYGYESEANNKYLERLGEANDAKYTQKLDADKAEINNRLIESEIFNNYINSELGLIDMEYLPRQYESNIFGGEIEKALDLLELEYKPQLYKSELESEELKKKLDEIELSYRPKFYDYELAADAINQALLELELKYTPDMYQSDLYKKAIENEFLWDYKAAELDEKRRNVRLKDLQAKYFLWK